MAHLQKKFKNVFQRLQAEKHVAVVHCRRGLHRTGTTAYTLSRLQGLDANAAYNGLKTMREATYEGVGEFRIQIAEKEYIPQILEMLKNEP